MTTKGKENEKGAKKAIKPEEKEIDFSDPLLLIDILDETNIGRVLQALKSLKSFVRRSCLNDLLDKDLLEKILRLIQEKKSPAEVLEFSLDLLSELLNFDKVVEEISEEEEFVLLLYSFIKAKPLDVQLQCVKVLTYLTKVDDICLLLSENCDLNLLLVRLSQKDPDMQTGLLKTMHNLVKNNIVIAEKFVNLPGFSYNPFLQMLSSDYPLVQHRSLNLIIQITSYSHLTVLREIFIQENGINFLMKMLETHKWPDLHEKVFKILEHVSNIPEMYNKLGQTGIQFLIGYVDDIESQKLQVIAFDTILNMAMKSEQGLKAFVDNEILNSVLKYFKGDKDSLMFTLSVKGITLLCESPEAMILIEEDPNLILLMFNVLNSKKITFDWSIRYHAAKAIYLMITKSSVFYDYMMENRKWEVILDLLDKYPKVAPYDLTLLLATILKRAIVDVYNCIDCPGEMCNKFIHVLKHLLIDPQCKRPELKCTASEMFEELIEFSELRIVLKQKKFYRCLSKLMFQTPHNLTILEANLKLFITLIEWDPTFIDDLNYINAIDWFIQETEIHRNLPIARRFLDLVFDKCKYIKIYFTNRLEPWDIIDSGFYIERGVPESGYFKSLVTYINEKYVKSRPIYYVNFQDKESIDELMKRFSDESTLTYFDKFSLYTVGVEEECRVDELEYLKDSSLRVYVEELKTAFGIPSMQQVIINLSEVLKRNEYVVKLKKLADFVCSIMNNLDKEEEECKNHSFELHLAELKNDLGSAVIPLGRLKLGMKFEKALLFKVLGDKVGIPSAFVRAHCGTAWNEVYLPPLPKLRDESLHLVKSSTDNVEFLKKPSANLRRNESLNRRNKSFRSQSLRKSVAKIDKRTSKRSFTRSKSLDSSEYQEPLLPPSWHLGAYEKYMKTNHIIDLHNNPGEIYQIGSVEAEDYMAEQIPPHPYFYERSPLPQLIKTSTLTQEQLNPTMPT